MVLSFAHRGFKQANGVRTLDHGLGVQLVSLQQYRETGKSSPHPDIDFARGTG